MATANSTATTPEGSRADPELEYKLFPWGDSITGTKEQLQSMGLGIGMAFPGEPGGKRIEMRVTDPRGFPTTIYSHCSGDGLFCANISLPGRERPKEEWKPFYFGVLKKEHTWYDEYSGTREALAAAGLVEMNQLPGQPGMQKVQVTICPDGAVATSSKVRREGSKKITKNAKNRYSVKIQISDEEQERRLSAYHEREADYERRMKELPRPEPLHVSGKETKPPKQKEKYYSSPESFREFALKWAGKDGSGSVFEFVFSGENELDEYGEITMRFDDQTLAEVASAYADFSARLRTLVENAKIIRARPHLTVVK